MHTPTLLVCLLIIHALVSFAAIIHSRVHVLVPLRALQDTSLAGLNKLATELEGHTALRVARKGTRKEGYPSIVANEVTDAWMTGFSDAGWTFWSCTNGTNCFAGMLLVIKHSHVGYFKCILASVSF